MTQVKEVRQHEHIILVVIHALFSCFLKWQCTQKFVEVALEEPVLHDTVLLKLRFGMKDGFFVAHAPGIIQQGPLVAAQIGINTLGPVLHCHRDMSLGSAFGKL